MRKERDARNAFGWLNRHKLLQSRDMGRRKKDDGWFEVWLSLFTQHSAWLCIPVAVVVFGAVYIGILVIAPMNPITKGFAPLAPMLSGVAALIVLLAGLKAGVEKGFRRDLHNRQTGIESIRALSWSQFELLIGEAYRRQRYQVTETGGGGADGGIDLILKSQTETVLVQCKQWKVYKVGVKPIRELYGVLMAEGADRAIFVTSGVYTREARDFATGKALELIDGEALCQMITPSTDRSSPPTRATEVDESRAIEKSPVCPVCHSSMVVRKSKRGDNADSEFWGCSTYPKCRGTRQLLAARS